jgi:hypothetical protein
LYNEELHNLYSIPDITMEIKSRRMKLGRDVACMGNERKVYRVLVEKNEGKRPLGGHRLRWECQIRIDLRKIVWGIYRGCSWFRIGTNGGLLIIR